MDIRKLQRAIVDGLEDVKAQNIRVFNTEHLSSLFERVIIASGTSNRQTKSLASSVRDAVKKGGYPVPRTEGEANGEWIIVDCGAAVVHVMQPAIRDYYHLEEIWGDKPVNLKLGSTTTQLVKAEEPAANEAAPTRAKKVVAKKAAAKRPAAPSASAPKTGRAAAPRSAAGARKTAAAPAAPRKAPAKRAAAPGGRVVTRVVGVKKAAPKKAASKSTSASKTAAPKRTARG